MAATSKKGEHGHFAGSTPYAAGRGMAGGASFPPRLYSNGGGSGNSVEIKDLSDKSYEDIIDIKGKMSDIDVRKWYDYHDRRIGEHIDKSKTIEDQAHQAHELRNTYKFQARELMADQAKREGLDRDFPLHDFDYYFAKYRKIYSSDDDTFKAIVDSSMRPNKEVNKKYGLE